MSDRSDQEDDLASDVADSPVEQDSDESETDQGDGFLDMEAEESDGYDEDEDEDGDEDHYHSDHGGHFSFPQFSRLPPELRAMIWEAVDPHLKSKGRVLDFYTINRGDFNYHLNESPTLSQQTAPARILLATNKESRRIALQHYPDTIQLDGGLFDIRFNGSQDIIFLREALPLEIAFGLEDWSDKIKYLALDRTRADDFFPTPSDDFDFEQAYKSLKAIFYCFDGAGLGRRKLDWSVSESSKQFYMETYEEQPGLGEDYKTLYCWPDTTVHANFVDRVGEGYMLDFPPLPAIYGVPIWPMAQYSFDSGLDKYHRVKRHYERTIGREAGSASPHESSEGESIYESELDDYARDGFVVGTSSEGEESSDDEDEGVHIHGPYDDLSDHDDLSGEDGGEDGVQLAQDLYVFNGFSPLQEESSDDEPAGNLPNTILVVRDLESPNDDLSNASSHEEQPRTIAETGRRKRHIVSSDGEDDGEDGGGSIVETSSRTKKRARVILSDSEDEEGGVENGTQSATEESSRLKKRARTVLSDSDGEEDERPRPADDELDEDEDEDDEDDEATEDEDDNEGEDESPVSMPTSLLARLRQFRSDVPIPLEGESSNSGEEFDEEERYEDDEGRQPSDVEFPESAGEDDEDEGW
ncbi:hypothetical protein GGR58DRAFT_476055 [Xylaria digitata]|nr:hypothetical protein GGR58DRAFT_476055 [Xylaria digitata]